MRVITTPSLLQVTLVAGPPVEVQVRVLDWSSKFKLVTMGEPAWIEVNVSDMGLAHDMVVASKEQLVTEHVELRAIT